MNKPAGMVVHPAPGSWNGTFVNALVYHLAMQGTPPARSEAPDGEHNPSLRPGIVHRLDKGTTGVLLAAKNPAMQAKLATLFAQREVGGPDGGRDSSAGSGVANCIALARAVWGWVAGNSQLSTTVV